jgi:SOS-response transcriptional repressor LexA
MRKTLITPKEFTQSGFTSPAEEYAVPDLKLDAFMIRNPEATYPARMDGDFLLEAGIPHGSYLLFDRGIDPKNGDIVYVWYKGQKLIRFYEKHGKQITLRAATNEFPTIQVDSELKLIGVITWSMKCQTPRMFPNVKPW